MRGIATTPLRLRREPEWVLGDEVTAHWRRGIAIFLFAHVPLGWMLDRSATLATFHAYATLVIALLWGVRRDRPERAAFAVAYITGSEVLWRMTEAGIFWEYGKYAVSSVLLTWLIVTGSFRRTLLPMLYLGLLVPSAILTLTDADPDQAKRMLSFNLSGPLSLGICAMFFLQIQLTRERVIELLYVLLAPILGVCTVAVSSTVRSSALFFTNNSNFETSGGFGPNQVSAILGLGALVLFLLLLLQRHGPGVKAMLFFGLLALGAQSAITFSRGGIYNALGAGAVGSLFLMRAGAHSRGRVMLLVLLVGALAYYILIPRLDAFSDGQLSKRFSTTHTSGRNALIEDDLAIWEKHLLLGVGPGQARFHRVTLSSRLVAHTEFSRLLSEHGLFGLLAGLVLLGMGLARMASARPGWRQALTATCVAWSFLYMMHAAMRLAAPSLLFGLAFAMLIEERSESIPDHREREEDELPPPLPDQA